MAGELTQLLQAACAHGAGRHEAAAELESAERIFVAAGLAAHPARKRIEMLQSGLD